MSNVSIDLDRVRSYNSKCNDYKKKLSNILAERKFMAERLEQTCAQLSKQLGMTVTPDNIEEVYESKSKEIMQTLETGEEILRRIESDDSDMTPKQQVVQNSMPVGGVDMSTPKTVNEPTGNPGGFNNGFSGMPQSDYRMPSGFADSLAGNAAGIPNMMTGGNAFIGNAKHSGFGLNNMAVEDDSDGFDSI